MKPMPKAETTLNESVARGHELRDVNVRGVLWFVAIFIVSAAVIHVGIGWMFLRMAHERANSFPAETPIVRLENVPSPRLQISPREDLEKLRAAEDAKLKRMEGLPPRE